MYQYHIVQKKEKHSLQRTQYLLADIVFVLAQKSFCVWKEGIFIFSYFLPLDFLFCFSSFLIHRIEKTFRM